jgi:predicted phage-related endonuclease
MIAIPRPPDRAEWLAARLDYFNASDAAALFGEHEFTTLGDIATRKLTRDTTDNGSTATRRGNYLEAAVASWWEDEHGIATYEPAELYVHGDVMATLDRRIVGNDSEAVEIKTTARRILDPLPSWRWQVQAQMYATGFERIRLVALDATMELQVFVIEADPEAQRDLGERASKFMESIRRGEIPPEAELTYHHRAALTPLDDGSAVALDDAQHDLVIRLAATRRLRRAADDEEERVKAALAEVLGAASVATHDQRPVLTWKTQTRSNVDVTRLRRERPEVATEFTITSTLRVMRLAGREG